METKLNHPFRLHTRTIVCTFSKLNSIIDSASHGGVTSSHLTNEACEAGILNDVANWGQTLKLTAQLPEQGGASFSAGILGSLVFTGDTGEVGLVFRLEEEPVILNAVATSMFFGEGSIPRATIVLTFGSDLSVDLLMLVSKIASFSAMLDDKFYRPSTDNASLYSDLMAILVNWRVKNQLSSPQSKLRSESYGFSNGDVDQAEDFHYDIAIAGAGNLSSRTGRYPSLFVN